MYRFSAVLYGVIAGAIGAAVWALIARFTGYEIGWIAWGVGLAVGVGVAVGNKGEGSPAAGVLAAALAMLAVVGGKYVTVQWMLPSADALVTDAVEALQDDELVISYLADGVIAERAEQGVAVTWPEGVDPQSASAEADYPKDVWAEALAEWNGMTAEARDEFRAALTANIESSMAAIRTSLAGVGFLGTFGLMDIIFFSLAIFTAYRIGRGGSLRQETA